MSEFGVFLLECVSCIAGCLIGIRIANWLGSRSIGHSGEKDHEQP